MALTVCQAYAVDDVSNETDIIAMTKAKESVIYNFSSINADIFEKIS